MEFKYKYYEGRLVLRKYLEAYCCEGQVKIKFTSSEKFLSDFTIEKLPDASDDIDIGVCFMEFFLFLSKQNKEHYTFEKVGSIIFCNMTIIPEYINLILTLCAATKEDYYKDKHIEFVNCKIPQDIKLGSLPCKGSGPQLLNCVIEDYKSLDGFRGDTLSITKSTIENYSGSITMSCKTIYLKVPQMNYPFFFLNTILPNIRNLDIDAEEPFDDVSLFFIMLFKNLYEITLPATIEDTYALDHLRNLAFAYGVWQRDPKTKKEKIYFGGRFKILESKHPEIYVDDDEFSLWDRRIRDKTLDDEDRRKHLEENREKVLKPTVDAYGDLKRRVEPFDIQFLTDIGALKVRRRRDFPFADELDRLKYYSVEKLYNPRLKKSRVQFEDGIIPLTRFLDNDSIFVYLEKNGIKIVDTRGGFTLEGTIGGFDEEQVRKTINYINSKGKRRFSAAYEIEQLKELNSEELRRVRKARRQRINHLLDSYIAEKEPNVYEFVGGDNGVILLAGLETRLKPLIIDSKCDIVSYGIPFRLDDLFLVRAMQELPNDLIYRSFTNSHTCGSITNPFSSIVSNIVDGPYSFNNTNDKRLEIIYPLHRDTIHFSINGLVSNINREGKSFASNPIVVIEPFKDYCFSHLVNINPVDTMVDVGRKDEPIKGNAVVVMPKVLYNCLSPYMKRALFGRKVFLYDLDIIDITDCTNYMQVLTDCAICFIGGLPQHSVLQNYLVPESYLNPINNQYVSDAGYLKKFTDYIDRFSGIKVGVSYYDLNPEIKAKRLQYNYGEQINGVIHRDTKYWDEEISKNAAAILTYIKRYLDTLEIKLGLSEKLANEIYARFEASVAEHYSIDNYLPTSSLVSLLHNEEAREFIKLVTPERFIEVTEDFNRESLEQIKSGSKPPQKTKQQ